MHLAESIVGSLADFKSLVTKKAITHAYSKVIPYALLLLLPIILFYHHFSGNYTWIGNPDRLNNHIKTLKYHSESLASTNTVSAWNEHEMMGYDSFILPHTFPNVLTYLTKWFGINDIYHFSWYLSLSLLILAGIATYLFISTIVSSKLCAITGAICYQFSTLALQKVSQNDMSFAVFIMIPLIGYVLKITTKQNAIRNLAIMSALFYAMLKFMFLQKVSYALIFLGSFALYQSAVKRTWLDIRIFSVAFLVGLIAAGPRIIGAMQAMGQYTRTTNGMTINNFASYCANQNIFILDMLRWFDNTIFGRFPSETGQLNQINMTEGFLLYTAASVPFLLLFAVLLYKRRKVVLPFTSKLDANFHFWFFMFGMLVMSTKPFLFILYTLFHHLDFNHARILMACLLPLSCMVALILNDIKPQLDNKVAYSRHALIIAVSTASAIAITLLIENIAQAQTGQTILPTTFLQKYKFVNMVVYQPMTLLNSAILRIGLSALAVLLLILGIRRSNINMQYFCFNTLCGLIIAQVLFNANFQINGKHTFNTDAPFTHGNYYYAPRDYFRIPNDLEISALHDLLDNHNYRSVLTCDFNDGGYCATGHVPELWRMRVIDGYYGVGVPARIAALPWNGNVAARTINFVDANKLPWKILALLNVKYALQITPSIYQNVLDSDNNYKSAIQQSDLTILENPEIVAPRAFFTASITAAENMTDASHKLFDNQDVFDLTNHSVVEGITADTQDLATSGAPILIGDGDHLEIYFDPAEQERFLVINELYFPGWEALIDNVKTKIFPTNVATRGVFVPAHANKVVLQYTPFVRSHYAYLFYAISLVILLGGMYWLQLSYGKGKTAQ